MDKELDITPEEIQKIQGALKDEKFRELFFDYCKEISDPENRAKYELEIQKLEKERGFDVVFVKPEAGHVIKAVDPKKNKKVFINVCTNENVENAKVQKSEQRRGKELVGGQDWTVPHILNPPRDDVDKAGNQCQVCDVMFHPEVYARAKKQKEVMNLINNIALDATEGKFGFNLDRNNIRYPKLKYKGIIEKTLLRNSDPNNPTKSFDDHMSKFVKIPEPKAPVVMENGHEDNLAENYSATKVKSQDGEPGKTTPEFKILHRGHFDMQDFTLSSDPVISTRPAELCIEIQLPTMKSAADIDLDVFEKRLALESKSPNYHLDIPLPYPVDEDRGRAQFDKSRKVLVVTLPVIKQDLKKSVALAKEKETVETGAMFLEGNNSSEHVSSKTDYPPANDYQGVRTEKNTSKDVVTNQQGYKTDAECASEDCTDMADMKRSSFVAVSNGVTEDKFHEEMSHSDAPKTDDNENMLHKARLGEITSNVAGESRFTDVERSGQSTVKENQFFKVKVSTDHVAEKSDFQIDTLSDSSGRESRCSEDDLVLSKERSLGRREDGGMFQRGDCSGQDTMPLKTAPKDSRQALDDDAKVTTQTHCNGHNENLMKCNIPAQSPSSSADVCNLIANTEPQSTADDRVDCEKANALSTRESVVKEDANGELSTPLDDMEFEFGDIVDIAGGTRLPPYDFDQDEETVTLNINLPEVRIEDVSLGFGSRKAYFSMTSDDVSSDATRWCLLLKLPDYYNLDQELCSVDVEPARLVIALRKSQDSIGTWNKLFVGTSEKDLEEVYFMTDHSMSEILGKMHQLKNPWVDSTGEPMALNPDQTLLADHASTDFLEAKLLQLLRDEDRGDLVGRDLDEQKATGARTEICKPKECAIGAGSNEGTAMVSLIKTSTARESNNSHADTWNSNEMTLDVKLHELQNDVIVDSDPAAGALELSRHPVERSCSDETNDSSNSQLRSILKRSTSEGAEKSDCSDESDHAVPVSRPSSRNRSKSLNVDYRWNHREPRSRARNKSVSFDPEPKVCEFVEYSKKQLKKMRKQERKQNEIAAKKMEAASKKAQGKHKGPKGGKNMNFFNGFRRDSGKIRGSENDTEKDNEANDVTHKESSNEESTQDPATSSSTAKSQRKLKKKKKADRKDERTPKEEERTQSPSEQLTNSLIFALDE